VCRRDRSKVGANDPPRARRPPGTIVADASGSTFASVDAGGVLIWSFRSGQVRRLLPNARVINAIDFTPSLASNPRIDPGSRSDLLVISGVNGRPQVYDPNTVTGPPMTFFEDSADGPIVDAAIDARINGYVVSTEDGNIGIFDLSQGRRISNLTVTAGPSPLIALNATGSTLAIVPSLRERDVKRREPIFIWDVSDDSLIKRIPVADDVVDIEFSPVSDRLYILTASGRLESWDIATGARQQTHDELNDDVRLIRVDPTGTLLAVAGNRGVSFFNSRFELRSTVDIGPVNDVAFAYDGAWAALAVEGGYLDLVDFDRVFDEPGEPPQDEEEEDDDDDDENKPLEFQPPPERQLPDNVINLERFPSEILSLAVSPSKRYLAIGEARGALTFYAVDPKQPRALATLFLWQSGQWLTYTTDRRFFGSKFATQILFLEDDKRIIQPYITDGWYQDEETIRRRLANTRLEPLEETTVENGGE